MKAGPIRTPVEAGAPALPAISAGRPTIKIARQPFTDTVCRVVDIVAATLLLTVLAPLFALIWLAIRLDSPGPALFRQRRCGRGARPFTIAKLRTMRHDTAADPHRTYVLGVIAAGAGGTAPPAGEGGLHKLENDARVTRVGAFLRRFSLDELPQLFNVLTGSMSLIGPRPCLPAEATRYTAEMRRRHAVKPGLTGLWQVSGRSQLDYVDMVTLDLDYVRRRSLWVNARILAKTVRVVLTGRGAV